jgi:hypothetical protein
LCIWAVADIKENLKEEGSMSTRIARPAGFALATLPAREVLDIKVSFTLNTRNGLRRVIFTLEKTTKDGVVKWTITFQLFEREKKTDPFGDPIVDLRVEVETKLHRKAQAMADNGMTPKQAAYAIGPGADKSKNKDKPKARKAVQDTLNK